MPPSFSNNYRRLIQEDRGDSVPVDVNVSARAPLHHYVGLAAYTALAFVAGVLTIGNQAPSVLAPEQSQAQVSADASARSVATSITLLPMVTSRFTVGEPVTVTAHVQGVSSSPVFQFEDQGIWQPDNGVVDCRGELANVQCEWSSTHVYQVPGVYAIRAQLLGPHGSYSEPFTVSVGEPESLRSF